MLEVLAKRAGAVEPGFGPKDVRWAIVCDERGTFREVLELGDTDAKRNCGQAFPVCPVMDRSVKQSGGKSEFLIDTAANVVLLGVAPEDAKGRAKHDYFVQLLREAGQAMPELAGLVRLLESQAELERVRERFIALGARPTESVTFKLGNAFPIESDRWHDWWRGKLAELTADRRAQGAAAGHMVCFATGDRVVPLPTHPKIKGLARLGGQRSGDVLVGFDKPAFQSYGLDQSTNAAVSKEAATAYSTALNALICKSSYELAGALVVHWFHYRVKPEEDLFSWLQDPPEGEERHARQRARDLLDSIASGQRADLAGNRYYALTLSGARGRVMVRDWMEGEFKELAENIRRWFEDVSIISCDGRIARDPRFLDVIGATARDLNDVAPPFMAKMWRVAVRCEPIPLAALAHALARVKEAVIGNKPFNHARMGLMKAYHIRSSREDGGKMKPNLNEEHPAPAYHCGRMMAVLAKLQQAALGDVGAGIVQRYYAAASATPALVLGRLVRGGQFHLNKLEPGLAHWYEEKLASISARLGDGVPQTLSLEEQSLFALGYYQQWVDLRTKRSDGSN
ncbi:MAG: CRISPR-associated protein, Csd1 family [Candidatus Bipolaricaulis sibiricus]|uniref:CRISPR-associated protein, Csd1 family n=1 Tax=Bipolaricaulis sibiricus TaxID=2501609 RepID=A0A410FUC5_BIPS1|nr:MAG: CRISPR-associated protein, Csd1 family [Candidatus Bipolaricaulis sibiricus]